MIEDVIKKHDQYQFEIKLNYKLNKAAKSNKYKIETYLFVPNSLDINRFTYKRDDFYGDLQSYIRFKTPTYVLNNIVAGENNPYDTLKESLENLVLDQRTVSNYEYQTKLFCCILKSALRDHVNFLVKKDNENDIKYLLEDFIKNVHEIKEHFCCLRKTINIPTIKEKDFAIYKFADEYISLLFEERSYRLLEIIKDNHRLNEKFKILLLDLIRSEIEYRKQNKYPSISEENINNEELLFRQSVLKKYTGNVLFLNIKRTKEGRFLEHFLFGIAAGIAMLFATAAAFYSQSIFGGLTLPVFVILVISYIFKDRIKELMRYYFSNKIRNHLYDHKLYIFTNPNDKIGYCKESMGFIKEYRLPEKIKKLRNKDHITEIENGWVGEKIILYREEIKIFTKKLNKVYHNFTIEGINDIMRFNIFKFLSKMDNPKKKLFVLKDKDYKVISGERVYHLNLVIKYTSKNMESFKRFRIILNRDGIKRIEKIEI